MQNYDDFRNCMGLAGIFLVENACIWSVASVHMSAHVPPYVRLRPAIWRLDEGHVGG